MSWPARVSTARLSMLSACVMPRRAARPVTVTAPLAPPLTVTASSPSVPVAITRSGWPSPPGVPRLGSRLTSTSSTPVALEVAERDRVRAAVDDGVDLVHVVEVQDDVLDVARQAQVAALGRQVERLGVVGPEEEQDVAAALAVDGVVAVARVPDEAIVVGAQVDDVVALPALDVVEAGAADEHVVAVAAEQHVGARPAVERQRDHVGRRRCWRSAGRRLRAR